MAERPSIPKVRLPLGSAPVRWLAALAELAIVALVGQCGS